MHYEERVIKIMEEELADHRLPALGELDSPLEQALRRIALRIGAEVEHIKLTIGVFGEN